MEQVEGISRIHSTEVCIPSRLSECLPAFTAILSMPETAHTTSLVASRAARQLKEEQLLVAAVNGLTRIKLHKAFRSWLVLTISTSDGSSEGEADDMFFRTQQQGTPSQRSPDASEEGTLSGAGTHSRQIGRTTSPGSLDTSADSGAFASPQGVGALTPVRREFDSVSPPKTGRGSLSPVQLLRRHGPGGATRFGGFHHWEQQR